MSLGLSDDHLALHDLIFTGATGLTYVVFRANGITQMGNEASDSYLADAIWCDTTARTALTMSGVWRAMCCTPGAR